MEMLKLKTKLKQIKWKKGNGTLLMGTFIMLLTLFIIIMFIQIFTIRQRAMDTQIAADTIADGTAVYMVNNGGNYDDAVQKADEIKELIKVNTGIDAKNITIDKDALENDNTVKVSLDTETSYLSKLKGTSANNYVINRTASTKFNGFTGGPLLSIAQSKLGSLYWWGHQGPDYFDCSGFVYWCYQQAGATGGYKSTSGLLSTFRGTQYEVSVADIQPGDIIICNGGNHVVFYFGNGMTIGCSGGTESTHGNNPNACVKFQNFDAAYRNNTVAVFRIPVEAY